VRLNTAQSILLRQLRQQRDQRRKTPASTRPDSAGATSSESPARARRKPFAKLRRFWNAMNDWLAAYYNVCGRTGLESSVKTSFPRTTSDTRHPLDAGADTADAPVPTAEP